MPISEIGSLVTILAILMAGAWTLYRFGLSRKQYPSWALVVPALAYSGSKEISSR